VMFEWIPRFD